MQLTERELELFRIMRSSKKEGDALHSPSLEYVAIYSGWLVYITGPALLYIYDPVRFEGITGACHRANLATQVDASAFTQDKNYKFLSSEDLRKLTQVNMPLTEGGPLMTSQEALLQISKEIPSTRKYNKDWAYTLVDLFAHPEDKISIHKGPHAKYLTEWVGTWFKKDGTQFLGILPEKYPSQ